MDIKYINEHPLEFTWGQNMLILDSSDRLLYDITNLTIVFKQPNLIKNLLYHLPTLIANELLQNPLKVFPS